MSEERARKLLERWVEHEAVTLDPHPLPDLLRETCAYLAEPPDRIDVAREEWENAQLELELHDSPGFDRWAAALREAAALAAYRAAVIARGRTTGA